MSLKYKTHNFIRKINIETTSSMGNIYKVFLFPNNIQRIKSTDHPYKKSSERNCIFSKDYNYYIMERENKGLIFVLISFLGFYILP